MFMIPFIEYLKPDGRRSEKYMPIAEDIEPLVSIILDGPHAFECEQLRTGEWSFTIHNYDTDEDVGIELSSNDANAMAGAVDRLIRGFEIEVP